MPQPPGPVFTPTPETLPFWEAARRHELMLPRCRACGFLFYYPRAACPRCLSGDLEWRRMSGRGRLDTFTVVHRGLPNFALGTPYIIAMVELEEGPRLMSNLVDVEPDPAKIRIGMPLEVVFRDVSDTIALPHFRPAEGAR
jgi:uncharacterized OB-fold protein